ncbi:MAG TPA: 3-methyladenine DNA glycosylase [Candidatus Yaniella excrementavium]|nr:3-methyladenine DNA glycosylase [Candidatus Yaniella excrementavium]
MTTELETNVVLPAEQWSPLAQAHRQRICAYTDPLIALHKRGIQHPVYDFLFSYYYLSAGALKRWHPGVGTIIANPDEHTAAPQAGTKFYRQVPTSKGLPHGGWTVDVADFVQQRSRLLDFASRLLPATEARPATLSCFGLHEWAMAYRSDTHGIRHADVPLRLGADGTDEVVESHKISCSHYDAFRFYAPEAREKNQLQPTRDTMVEMEQPGCLHANMDLYKWATKLIPAISSSLVADCFELAWDIRVVDMQASPYDLAAWGFEPICIETAEGKAQYVQAQRAFSERAQVLRRRLIDAIEQLSRSELSYTAT